MINPIASESEAINSATYVDNYIDSVENLPDDVQRQLSRIRDIDVQYRGLIRDVDHYYDLYLSLQNSTDMNRRSRSMSRMHQSLIQAQELGDEKMQIVNYMQEIIDGKLRQLDTDQHNLDLKEDRERFGQLEDGPSSKLQRLQSPMRDQANSGVAGLNGHGSNNVNYGGKDYGLVSGYGSAGSGTGLGGGISGNGGGSTPNSERSSHVSNGGGNGSNGNGSAGGSELQRTGSKRSRRRNESLVNNGSSLEIGGNESNSANEAGGSGNGGNSERKNSLSAGSSSQRKGNLQSVTGLASGSSGTGNGGGNGGGGGGGGGAGGNNSGKKKKRKVRGGAGTINTTANAREETPPPEPIDPDEPTYCVCNQISFGEMILCDNDLCPIEWFHFSCVSLVLKPKGKWFCPNCRGERPNVMKPKAQFLKELERYNKEKEEKT
ncbi:uncharacterized protein Dwil_GK22501 [Drosophila willistoni]|uniref:Inhibitor of growth protein n=1 Tax=Drosophila willistoni TaxID=7260 RepID=B4NFL6_DROWI|nr:inhibitor of growth protein 1 [Drosophila willistoni]EDW83083.1 uncharacterized protein Dwil_GK22501 [Drosophila willistoni]